MAKFFCDKTHDFQKNSELTSAILSWSSYLVYNIYIFDLDNNIPYQIVFPLWDFETCGWTILKWLLRSVCLHNITEWNIFLGVE